MISPLTAALLTFLLGPFLFFFWSRRQKPGLKRFPVGIVDGVGDVVLLPAFNAIAVASIVFVIDLRLLVAFVTAYILAKVFLLWRKNMAKHDDWTRPKRGSFNVAGWYHWFFLWFQTAFILWSLILSPKNLSLWSIVLLFLLLVFFRFKTILR